VASVWTRMPTGVQALRTGDRGYPSRSPWLNVFPRPLSQTTKLAPPIGFPRVACARTYAMATLFAPRRNELASPQEAGGSGASAPRASRPKNSAAAAQPAQASRQSARAVAFARGREAASLLLFVTAIFTVLALLSFEGSPTQLELEGPNWVGPVGSTWARFLVGAIGFTSWALPAELLLLAWPLFKDRASIATIARLAGDFLVLLILAALVQVALPTATINGAMPVSGSVGELFGELMRSLFSTIGSFLIGLTAIGLILIGRASFSFIAWVQKATRGTEVAANKAASSARAVASAWERAAELRKQRELEARPPVTIHEAPVDAALADALGADDLTPSPPSPTVLHVEGRSAAPLVSSPEDEAPAPRPAARKAARAAQPAPAPLLAPSSPELPEATPVTPISAGVEPVAKAAAAEAGPARSARPASAAANAAMLEIAAEPAVMAADASPRKRSRARKDREEEAPRPEPAPVIHIHAPRIDPPAPAASAPERPRARPRRPDAVSDEDERGQPAPSPEVPPSEPSSNNEADEADEADEPDESRPGGSASDGEDAFSDRDAWDASELPLANSEQDDASEAPPSADGGAAPGSDGRDGHDDPDDEPSQPEQRPRARPARAQATRSAPPERQDRPARAQAPRAEPRIAPEPSPSDAPPVARPQAVRAREPAVAPPAPAASPAAQGPAPTIVNHVEPPPQPTPARPQAPQQAPGQPFKRTLGLAPKAPFRLPGPELLDPPANTVSREEPEALLARARELEKVLANYGVKGTVADIHTGPTVSTFEVVPAEGTKVRQVAGLDDDLALGLSCKVRIVAPIPGKSRIGFELPNRERVPVNLRELVEDRRFQEMTAPLPMVIGRDIVGAPVYVDMATFPHVIVAGATGAGKSVGLNVMLISLLMRRTPEQVRLLMVDPKVVELAPFDRIPHLLLPVVTDMKQASNALKWAVDEMERRYQLFANAGTKNIGTYNGWVERVQRGEVKGFGPGKTSTAVTEDGSLLEAGPEKEGPPVPDKLPWIVIVVDEFADLIMQQGKDVEASIARLAQKARAAGMHVILATQRPSTDVITGTIKSNFPSRIAFRVVQWQDSKTILDEKGAEQLLGKGDMLVKLNGAQDTKRVQGPFVFEEEVQRVTDFLRAQGEPVYDESIVRNRDEEDGGDQGDDGELDPKYDDAVRVVAETQKCSTSWLQRKLGLGYNRAAKIVEVMEKRGVVGPANGAKDREVLVAPL
jgi:DNA segregation ATPase FtsK/SpoIIIE, S-DNA-T family